MLSWVVLSPEAMIDSSDFIFTGKVVEKEYTEEQRTVKIEIDRILKGNENIRELTLTRQKPKMYWWLGFDFPEVVNKVFVLLNKSKQEYIPNFDLNYVAIVNEDDKIELYNSNSINGVGKEAYATLYEKFLKENHSKAIIPKKNVLEQKVDKDIQLSEVSDNNDDYESIKGNADGSILGIENALESVRVAVLARESFQQCGLKIQV